MKKTMFIAVVLVLLVAFGISAFMVGDYLVEGKKQAERFDELSEIANGQTTQATEATEAMEETVE